MKLILADEINCQFMGLPKGTLAHLRKQLSIPDPNAFMVHSYKIGLWDGRQDMVDEEGITFQYLIPKALDVLEEYEVDIDSIEVEDNREPVILPEGLSVDDDWLLEESGFPYRHYQTTIVNKILSGNYKGIINAATSAGKSLICLGISKKVDPYIKTVIVVPDENLAKQTAKDYANSDLNFLLLSAKVKPEKREQAIRDHRHIILTSKLFMNTIQWFKEEQFVLLLDEVHKVCGDVMLDVLRFDVPHWQCRIGLTGTVPKDKLKKTKICCHLGGDIIHKVTPRELQDNGYASTVHITMKTILDKEMEELFNQMYETRDQHGNRAYDWSIEQDYMFTNNKRAMYIADYINTLEKTNTLVLCHPQLGNMIAPLVGVKGCISDDISPETRLEWLEDFNTKKDALVLASFGTASTGLSYNHIYRVILVDVGKNFSYILQSIGRAMRLDGINNHAEIIDISSNTIYSQRHRNERIKIYKQEKFDYTVDTTPILVGE